MNEFVGTQLSGWDAATFRTASGDPTMRSTVVAVAVLESTPDWDRLRDHQSNSADDSIAALTDMLETLVAAA